MKLLRSLLLACLAVGFIGACYQPPTNIASRYVKSETVYSSQGAIITVSEDESPELSGLALEIAPGALSYDEVITVEVGEEDIVRSGDEAAGPVAVLGPAGLIFNTPARLTLPYDVEQTPDPKTLYVQVEEDDGRRFVVPHQSVAVDEVRGTVSFSIVGFTAFQGCRGPSRVCNATSDCSAGESCVQGSCQTTQQDAGVCTANADCAAGQECIQGNCQTVYPNDGGSGEDGGHWNNDGGHWNNDGGHWNDDGGSWGGVCVSNADCFVGQTCVRGYCTANQTDGGGQWNTDGGSWNGDGGSWNMDGGGWGGTCVSNADCFAGQTCVQGYCQTSQPYDGGQWNMDAGSWGSDGGGWTGDGGWGGACTSNADCFAGETCVRGYCQATQTYDGGQWNDDGGQWYQDGGSWNGDGGSWGGACTAHTDCGAGQACVQGYCQATQTYDAGSSGADAGQTGGSDAGIFACTTHSECPVNQRCNNGVCM